MDEELLGERDHRVDDTEELLGADAFIGARTSQYIETGAASIYIYIYIFRRARQYILGRATSIFGRVTI